MAYPEFVEGDCGTLRIYFDNELLLGRVEKTRHPTGIVIARSSPMKSGRRNNLDFCSKHEKDSVT